MSDIVLVAIISAIPGTIAAAMGIINVLGTSNANARLKDIHISINSRMDELLKYGKAESKEIGRAEGIQEERNKL